MKNIFCVILLIISFSCESPEPPDLIVLGGTIYTTNPNQPTVEAVAVEGEYITRIGSEKEITQLADQNTVVLDLQGRTMIPGFIESHAHLMGLGFSKLNLDLSQARSYQDLIDLVGEAVNRSQPGEWIIGRGWHQSKWDNLPVPNVGGFQTHEPLSAVSPENPVFLYHASGHAGFANAKAMELAEIDQSTVLEENLDGEIIKYESGKPTGVFTEQAENLINRVVPKASFERRSTALDLAIETCLENGVTSFQDAGSNQEDIDLFGTFLDQGKLPIRLWVMLDGSDSKLLEKWYLSGPKIGSGNNHLTIKAIKLYADGALGSRGAWLLEPYSDRPEHYGNKLMNMDDIYTISRRALETGFQVCTHAIGDRANREVLDQYERAFRENHDAAARHRFRIEHAQHLHPDDIPRFSELRVIASMQAIHLSSDRPWAIDRLDSQRIVDGAYVWKSLLATGAKVINGTDAPVEPVSPLHSFYSSVARKTLGGEPDGGFEPSQKMSRAEALRSYTLDAAYGAHEEEIKGSIEEGKLADFTVLSKNIMEIPEEEILDTEIELTIVDGVIEYQKTGN